MVGTSNDSFPCSMPMFIYISLNVKVHLREKSFHLLPTAIINICNAFTTQKLSYGH